MELFNKSKLLYIILLAFFVCNAIVAEFIGVKIFALEDTLGLDSFNWQLFGQEGSLNFTAGVLLWPVVFIMTDIINEYFGKRGVRIASYLAAGLIAYAFAMIYLAIQLAPAAWWTGISADKGVPDMQEAYEVILGQGLWIIVGSLVAFLIGQLVDVMVFQTVKKWTGEKALWLRATGSTLVSQFIDSFVVLYIAFVIGPQQWSISLFLAVGTVNYLYKFAVAVLLTPALYLVHYIIDEWLGEPLATRLKDLASGKFESSMGADNPSPHGT